MAEVGFGKGFGDAESFGFVGRTAVSAEEPIHEGRDVGVVAGVAFSGMVPVMEFGRADQNTQRADGEPDIRMDVNGPETAKSEETGERFQREAKQEGRKVDEAQGVNRIQRVFPVRGQPVEMFGAVMDGVKTPEEFGAVLQAVTPINQQVAEQDYFDGLEPPGLGSDGRAKSGGNEGVELAAEELQDGEHSAAP